MISLNKLNGHIYTFATETERKHKVVGIYLSSLAISPKFEFKQSRKDLYRKLPIYKKSF